METKETRHAIKFGTRLAVAFTAILVMLLSAVSGTNVTAAEPDLLAGITFEGAVNDADVAYLRDSLQMLRDQLPSWWQHVVDAKPFILSLDLAEGARGRAAIAKCCDARGYGSITFGHHFGALAASDDAGSQSVEARRITFLGLLIHEITHVRDQRAGRFAARTDRKTCVAEESSGLSKQLEFKQDAAAVTLFTSPSAGFQPWLGKQIQDETNDLRDRAFWDLYCGDLPLKAGFN